MPARAIVFATLSGLQDARTLNREESGDAGQSAPMTSAEVGKVALLATRLPNRGTDKALQSGQRDPA